MFAHMARGWVVGVGIAVAVGCGSDSSSGSMQTQCHQLMTAFCGRAYQECTQSSDNFDACVSVGTSACCQNLCNKDSATLQASIDKCSTEMHAISCSELSDPSTVVNALPADCRGIVRPSSANPAPPPGTSMESAAAAALRAQ